jgi:hypothetical protein
LNCGGHNSALPSGCTIRNASALKAGGSAESFIICRTDQAEQKQLQFAVSRKLSDPFVRKSFTRSHFERV